MPTIMGNCCATIMGNCFSGPTGPKVPKPPKGWPPGAQPQPRPGGSTAVKDLGEVKSIVAKVTAQVEKEFKAAGRKGVLGQLEVVEALSQVVAGRNFFVKIKFDSGKLGGSGEEYAFLRIYDRFGDFSLTSVVWNKK